MAEGISLGRIPAASGEGAAFPPGEGDGVSAFAQLKLHAWLSPSFPVGAFSYSHGLEWAIRSGDIHDSESLGGWIGSCLRHGAGRNDAILLTQVMRGGDADELDALACALAPSRERLLETQAQGVAFAGTVAASWGGDATPRAYPVALGRAARAHRVPEAETVRLYLFAFASSLLSVGIRLVPIGQTDGQRVLDALAPVIVAVAEEARAATLDMLGGCAFRADIAAMRHETQDVRLFRS